jgi:hypothetical protein
VQEALHASASNGTVLLRSLSPEGSPSSNGERMSTKAKTKKPAKVSKRAKPGKPTTAKDAHAANGTIPEQPEANGSTGYANGTPKPSKPERKLPVTYSDEVANIILQRLQEGESLLSICQSEDLPSESAVRQWAADPSHPFAANYARAREVGYLKMADEVIALSDGLEAGNSRFEPGVVQRHRLMVDSRKWILSKALPKIYGDRLEVDAKAGLVVVETPAAIRALLDAMPELMSGKVIDAMPQPAEPAAEPALIEGEQS